MKCVDGRYLVFFNETDDYLRNCKKTHLYFSVTGLFQDFECSQTVRY